LRDELSDVREAAERIRQIVGDLKLFSRAAEDRRTSVDLPTLLDSSLRMAANEIRHRARLIKAYEPVPPIEANASRLGQVFVNLFVNAAHAIPEGHADDNEIRVATRQEADGRILIEISDTGSGMPREVLERLFTPFFTTKAVGSGTGLGLAICHRIVSGLGGEISVESRVGVGSVFRVRLPGSQASEARLWQPPPQSAPAVRRGRVLIVDDDAMIVRAMRRLLSTEHEVKAFRSAHEALALLAAGERFDVILCDLMMPAMTGMELHAKVSQLAPEQAARMIFLTGGAFSAQAQAFLDAGTTVWLNKPFDRESLRSIVNERIALDRRPSGVRHVGETPEESSAVSPAAGARPHPNRPRRRPRP